MARLKEIADLGRTIYTPEGLRAFLATPLPVFEGRTGFDFLQRGDDEPVLVALAPDVDGTGF